MITNLRGGKTRNLAIITTSQTSEAELKLSTTHRPPPVAWLIFEGLNKSPVLGGFEISQRLGPWVPRSAGLPTPAGPDKGRT
ncbi:hypothetical protein CMUS01_09942 [Colletotrichum musicola]|uniref:Uncharacterized protein n=1 Tax=Colletotrichum musicola TaxID=2175873 RepID=A0A8H6N9G9_9PEZI|nr:hypothetical protein CMUS01_09942 [Colletotrichum musicola]